MVETVCKCLGAKWATESYKSIAVSITPNTAAPVQSSPRVPNGLTRCWAGIAAQNKGVGTRDQGRKGVESTWGEAIVAPELLPKCCGFSVQGMQAQHIAGGVLHGNCTASVMPMHAIGEAGQWGMLYSVGHERFKS